jgi:hypothetical protein
LFNKIKMKRLFYSSGYNIGVRLIDDFLSRNPNVGRCHDFRETADVLAKVNDYSIPTKIFIFLFSARF